MRYWIQRGDVVLFMSSSKLGAAVGEGQRKPGEKYQPPARHAAVVVEDGNPADEPSAVIVEAAYPFVRRVPLYPTHAADMVWCYRPVFIPPFDLEDIVRRIEARVGEPYPYLDLLTAGIDTKVFGGHPVTSWLTRVTWGSKCSSLVAEEFERRNRVYRISKERGWFATPAGIQRWVTATERRGAYPVPWNGFPQQWRAA